MFYQLPPAGNPVNLLVNKKTHLPEFLHSSVARFYASGTAALAAAVVAAITRAKIPEDVTAEVILPAYGCPDLVSAIIYAGAKPVLVDLQADRPWLDLVQLEKAINTNTAAIIGVNLFGISERWAQLYELASQAKIILIEDSAQYFPGIDEQESWQGDMVVFSFGRGKPVSLLGGGAVMARQPGLYNLLPSVSYEVSATSLKQRISFAIKAKLYNAMISPYLYWLPQALPFLHLGETRYHALSVIEAMDAVRKNLLSANILRYQRDKKAARCSGKISAMLASVVNDCDVQVVDLPVVCEMPENRRLLRYPILVGTAVREGLYQKLKEAGLGASVMYPASLPEIEGLEPMLAGQNFPQAQTFASRLITLPVHAGVGAKDIEKMAILLKNA